MKGYAVTVLVVGLVLIALSLLISAGQGPDAWLIEWTNWAISYVSLAVAAHAVIKLSNGLEKYMIRKAENG